jgi:hypothetical protein
MKISDRTQTTPIKPPERERPKPPPVAEKAVQAEAPKPPKSGNVGQRVDIKA